MLFFRLVQEHRRTDLLHHLPAVEADQSGILHFDLVEGIARSAADLGRYDKRILEDQIPGFGNMISFPGFRQGIGKSANQLEYLAPLFVERAGGFQPGLPFPFLALLSIIIPEDFPFGEYV